MANTTTAPRSSAKPVRPKQEKTTELVKEIRQLLDSDKNDLEIVRHIAGELDIPVTADLRLATMKFIVRPAVFLNSGRDTAPGDSLGKHHLDTAIQVIKTALNDFTQQNPYHAEYSFAAIYDTPSRNGIRYSSTWHYGVRASATLWPWPKIETALLEWLLKQPATKKVESVPVTYRLVEGQCNVSVIDSRGNIILKQEFATIHADAKTKGQQVTKVALR